MKIIETENAPAAIGPYSQAVKVGDFVFCSGQIALNKNGELVSSDVIKQAEQIMENISEVLKAAGTDFSKVVKTTIFLTDMGDFAVVNEVYARYFADLHKPARSTVAVASLPKGVSLEIECIAKA